MTRGHGIDVEGLPRLVVVPGRGRRGASSECGPYAEALASGALLRLAPRRAVAAAEFAQLCEKDRARLKALALVSGTTSAVLVAKSAALLNGVWAFHEPGEVVELALPDGGVPGRAARACGTRYRSMRLDPQNILVRGSVRASSPVRTALDIARLHGFRQGLVAFDGLAHEGVDFRDVVQCLDAMGRVVGGGIVRQCLGSASGLSGSPYESLIRALLLEAMRGGELPQCGVEIAFEAIRGVEFALCLGGWLLVDVVAGGRGATEADRILDDELRRHGFTVLRFSEAAIESSAGVLDTVRRALTAGPTQHTPRRLPRKAAAGAVRE